MYKGNGMGPDIAGVFPLTPYPSFNKNDFLVTKIFEEDNFSNESISIDFNDAQDSFITQKSMITFNGVETSNVKWGDAGIVYQ
jgi:hypothetical protein